MGCVVPRATQRVHGKPEVAKPRPLPHTPGLRGLAKPIQVRSCQERGGSRRTLSERLTCTESQPVSESPQSKCV